jgi:hypothetical protein
MNINEKNFRFVKVSVCKSSGAMGITVNIKCNSVQIYCGFRSWKEKHPKKYDDKLKHRFIFAVTYEFKTLVKHNQKQ